MASVQVSYVATGSGLGLIAIKNGFGQIIQEVVKTGAAPLPPAMLTRTTGAREIFVVTAKPGYKITSLVVNDGALYRNKQLVGSVLYKSKTFRQMVITKSLTFTVSAATTVVATFEPKRKLSRVVVKLTGFFAGGFVGAWLQRGKEAIRSASVSPAVREAQFNDVLEDDLLSLEWKLPTDTLSAVAVGTELVLPDLLAKKIATAASSKKLGSVADARPEPLRDSWTYGSLAYNVANLDPSAGELVVEFVVKAVEYTAMLVPVGAPITVRGNGVAKTADASGNFVWTFGVPTSLAVAVDYDHSAYRLLSGKLDSATVGGTTITLNLDSPKPKLLTYAFEQLRNVVVGITKTTEGGCVGGTASLLSSTGASLGECVGASATVVVAANDYPTATLRVAASSCEAVVGVTPAAALLGVNGRDYKLSLTAAGVENGISVSVTYAPAPSLTLTTTKTGGGVGTVVSGNPPSPVGLSTTVARGSEVFLTAVPDANSVFDRWNIITNGKLVEKPFCETLVGVLISDNVEARAVFAPRTTIMQPDAWSCVVDFVLSGTGKASLSVDPDSTEGFVNWMTWNTPKSVKYYLTGSNKPVICELTLLGGSMLEKFVVKDATGSVVPSPNNQFVLDSSFRNKRLRVTYDVGAPASSVEIRQSGTAVVDPPLVAQPPPGMVGIAMMPMSDTAVLVTAGRDSIVHAYKMPNFVATVDRSATSLAVSVVSKNPTDVLSSGEVVNLSGSTPLQLATLEFGTFKVNGSNFVKKWTHKPVGLNTAETGNPLVSVVIDQATTQLPNRHRLVVSAVGNADYTAKVVLGDNTSSDWKPLTPITSLQHSANMDVESTTFLGNQQCRWRVFVDMPVKPADNSLTVEAKSIATVDFSWAQPAGTPKQFAKMSRVLSPNNDSDGNGAWYADFVIEPMSDHGLDSLLVPTTLMRINVNANPSLADLVVKVEGEGAGTVTGGGKDLTNGAVASFAKGATVTLTAKASGDSNFVGWEVVSVDTSAKPIYNVTQVPCKFSLYHTGLGTMDFVATSPRNAAGYAPPPISWSMVKDGPDEVSIEQTLPANTVIVAKFTSPNASTIKYVNSAAVSSFDSNQFAAGTWKRVVTNAASSFKFQVAANAGSDYNVALQECFFALRGMGNGTVTVTVAAPLRNSYRPPNVVFVLTKDSAATASVVKNLYEGSIVRCQYTANTATTMSTINNVVISAEHLTMLEAGAYNVGMSGVTEFVLKAASASYSIATQLCSFEAWDAGTGKFSFVAVAPVAPGGITIPNMTWDLVKSATAEVAMSKTLPVGSVVTTRFVPTDESVLASLGNNAISATVHTQYLGAGVPVTVSAASNRFRWRVVTKPTTSSGEFEFRFKATGPGGGRFEFVLVGGAYNSVLVDSWTVDKPANGTVTDSHACGFGTVWCLFVPVPAGNPGVSYVYNKAPYVNRAINGEMKDYKDGNGIRLPLTTSPRMFYKSSGVLASYRSYLWEAKATYAGITRGQQKVAPFSPTANTNWEKRGWRLEGYYLELNVANR